MQTKLAKLRALWASGDRMGALRLAARFPDLGPQKRAITQAWAASQNPGFYRQIGRDPEELLVTGLEAMAERWAL